MNNDNIYKKLRFFALCLAIICMVLSLIKKAKAEEITVNNLKDYYISLLNPNNTNQYDYDTLLDFETFPYTFMLKSQSSVAVFMWKYNNYILKAMNDGDINNSTYKWTTFMFGGSNNNDQIAFKDNWVKNNSDAVGRILIYDDTHNISFIAADYYPTDNPHFNSANTYCWASGSSRQIENIPYENNRVNQYIIDSTRASDIYIPNDVTIHYCGYGTYISGGTYKGIITDNMPYVYKILIQNNNTSGFSVFKYNNLGIDTLRIVPPKNKVMVGSHTSNISTVKFDLVIDGTIIPTTYNSESEFYYESIEYNRAYYEIPFNTLLPSSINDFNNVYVTNVVYNNSWENQGGETGNDTFYYVDKVYLKQTIDNDNIGQVSITHIDTNTGYDETHITDIYNMITNASTISGEFNTEKNLVGGSSTPYSFTSFQDAIVRTVECYHPTGSKSTDWTPIINENGIEFESGDNMYWLEYIDNTQVFNNRYNYNISPYSYIRENNYTGYYDILYFIVHEQVYSSNGTGFSTLDNSYTRYFYFISDRYYNKLILYREMDLMEYIKLNNEISEKVYNYLYDRLLNIDDNLYYYIKDKANIDNDILTTLENIDNDMQFSLDVLNDLLNKILTALSDLKLTQLDTIETKLNTIIANIGQNNTQNEDDTVAEAIKYYKSHNNNGVPTGQVYIDDKMSIWISGKVHLWLQGTDANTDKTNLINSVFDTLTSIYDSMKNNNDIFPNIQYYLDAIAKNNNYAYETHGDYMTRLFKGNVDISTYSGISE